MKIVIKKPVGSVEFPCLMINHVDEVVLVTENSGEDTYYVTRLGDKGGCVMTYRSDLRDYKPVPAGTTIVITA